MFRRCCPPGKWYSHTWIWPQTRPLASSGLLHPGPQRRDETPPGGHLTIPVGELGAGKGPWSLTGPLAQSITAHEIGMLGRKDGQAREEEPMH